MNLKINAFIKQYELEQIKIKQKNMVIRKQVMQQIIERNKQKRSQKNNVDNNKKGNASNHDTFKTSLSGFPQEMVLHEGVHMSEQNRSRVEEEEQNQFKQITFNAKKHNLSLDQKLRISSITNKRNQKYLNEQSRNKETLMEEQIKKKIRMELKQIQSKQEKQEHYSKKNKQQRQYKYLFEDEPENKTELPLLHTFSKKEHSYVEIPAKIIPSNLINKFDNDNRLKQSRSNLKITKRNTEQIQEQEHERNGVFMTLPQEESITQISTQKNCAFQIKTNGQHDEEQLQRIKKIKIREFQKKREQRMLEFKKHSLQKKDKQRKQKNTSLHNVKQRIQVSIRNPPQSAIIERKTQSNKRQIKREQYIAEQTPKVQSKGVSRYGAPPLPSEIRTVSPFRGQKTSLKNINHSKDNIFVDSQRERSSSKGEKNAKSGYTRQSNKKLMINAITYTCFPGDLNRREREKLIDVLETSPHEFFVLLFKDSCKIIKAIYTLNLMQTKLQKVHGEKGPSEILPEKVKEFYRFDSGSREFKKVDGCKSFSFAVHAVDL